MAEPLRKESLKVDLATAREQLAAHSLGLRRNLNVGEHFKRGFRRHPAAWFGGAALLGLLLSRIPARRRQVKVAAVEPLSRAAKKAAAKKNVNPAGEAGKAAFAATALKVAIDLAKPSLMRWVKERAKDFAEAQMGAHTQPPQAGVQSSGPGRSRGADSAGS